MLSGMGIQLTGFAGEIKLKNQCFLQQVLISTLGWSKCVSSCPLLASCLPNGIITWGFAVQVLYCSQRACPLPNMGVWTRDEEHPTHS